MLLSNLALAVFGPNEVLTNFHSSNPEDHGVVPRACTEIFARMDEADVSTDYIAKVSYVEVYCDRLRDLLGGKNNLSIRETPEKVPDVDRTHQPWAHAALMLTSPGPMWPSSSPALGSV